MEFGFRREQRCLIGLHSSRESLIDENGLKKLPKMEIKGVLLQLLQ